MRVKVQTRTTRSRSEVGKTGRSARLQGVRLDEWLVAHSFTGSLDQARALVAGGLVDFEGQRARSSALVVTNDGQVEVRGPGHPWVGRGGIKKLICLCVFSERSRERNVKSYSVYRP